jgi:predicted transcriptional regulator
MALPDGIDRKKLLEVALAMLHLTAYGDRFGARAWKGMNWELLDALHEEGWISDPKSKAKSVALTDEGERLAAEFFEKHFGRRTRKAD